ncbi:MAG: DUF2442 domain-containing protein [Oscillospiraceae bacterium]|nr:DUF2442 domain-containing protein [Oscillospiraceae bacterium]
MYEVDGILYAGEPESEISVQSVQATDDYKLLLKFSNGEDKIYNANELIKSGVFTKLQDISLFKQAHVDYGTVVWNEILDISPEYLYENSAI